MPQYDTGGTYPQVRAPDLDLSAVNAALRALVLTDQLEYARSARRFAGIAGKDARGVYQTSVNRRLLSASTVVVSALIPAHKLYPGGTGGRGWLAGTFRVPSGAPVKITDLFTDTKRALRALEQAWKAELRRTKPHMWPCATKIPEAYRPSANNYRYFALTPPGLAVGFSGPAACDRLEATVPYPVVRPHPSRLGAALVAGVRRPR